MQMMQHALTMAFFVVALSLIDVRCSLGKQRVDQSRQLVRGGLHSLGFVEPGTQSTIVGPQC